MLSAELLCPTNKGFQQPKWNICVIQRCDPFVLLIDVFLFHSYPLITSVLSLTCNLNNLRAQIFVRCVTLRNNCFVLCTNSRNNVIVGVMFQLCFGQAKTSNKVLLITIVILPSILFSLFIYEAALLYWRHQFINWCHVTNCTWRFLKEGVRGVLEVTLCSLTLWDCWIAEQIVC